MFDIYKLHNHRQIHIESEKKEQYGKELRDTEMEIVKIQHNIIQLKEEKANTYMISNELFKLQELKKKLPILKEKFNHNHIADYLLEALPLIQRYSRLEHSTKPEDKLECKQIINSYVNKHYKYLKNKVSAEDDRNETPQKLHSIMTESKCCKAQVFQSDDGSLVCKACGIIIAMNASFTHNPMLNLSYNRNITPNKVYSYRRLNHLRELIRQITGKTQNNLSRENLEIIKHEVKKNYLEYEQVTPSYVRKILKKLGMNKYYDQTVSITLTINPKFVPPKISSDYEEKLIIQFVMLEAPFEKIRQIVDSKRKNFLSYRYTFYRLNQLNKRMDLNHNIHLLKSVKLLNKQDKYWKLLMKELNWPYLGTLSTRESYNR